jgi:V/A-type H+-transporting ATPase subunit D
MATLRIPPGRAGRIWLRDRLAVATSALSLLERKRALLEGEQRRLRAHREQTARDWARACADAREWQTRAALFGGTRAMIAAAPVQHADITVHGTTLAGVRYPDHVEYALPQADSSEVSSGASLSHAREAHRHALVAAAGHAAAAAAVAAVEQELSATRIRAQALRHRRIPALQAALAQLELSLEERERAERIPGHHTAPSPDTAPG